MNAKRVTREMNYGRDQIIHKKDRYDMDTIADTICTGIYFRLLESPGMTCYVKGFYSSVEAMTNIPVARVAMACMTDSGKTLILIINQALYFWETLGHSLSNQNQICMASLPLITLLMTRDFDIDTEVLFIPFPTKRSTIFF